MADSYTKSLTLDLRINDESLKKAKEELAERPEDKAKKASMKDKVFDEFKTVFKANMNWLTGNVKKVITNINNFVVKSFKDAWKELKEMSSYNLGGSYKINAEAREQAMEYGLSNAQNYAFSKTKDFMKITSDEDLFYMNEKQRETFAERIAYYNDKYEKLSNEGFFETMEQFEIEFAEFKEDFMYDVAEFFMENKDTIKEVLKLSMDFMRGIMQALGWILDKLGMNERNDSDRLAATSDIINNANNNSRTTNIKVDQSFTNTGADKNWIADEFKGSLVQLAASLK